MTTLDSAVVLALHRAAVYRLLAAAFADPTPARLGALAVAAIEASAGAPAGLRESLRSLAAVARQADAATLAGEHVSLFQRQVSCPPYEGAYGPPQMGGKATLLADVAGFYRAFGLEPAEGFPEVEDHIGTELEFMSLLALKEAWALAESHDDGLAVTRDAQRAFLADHLGRWGAAFARRVITDARPDFYPISAALLESWLTEEFERHGVAPAPLEGVTAAETTAFTCPMAPASEE